MSAETFLNGELTDLAAGKAGEYLVCADLILRGHVAFPSEQGLSYDVVADIAGTLLKIQVKTTRCPRPVPQRANHIAAYMFHILRCGKGGRGSYGESVDLFALVALDTKTIGYLLPSQTKRTMIFRSPALRGAYKNELDKTQSSAIHVDLGEGKLRNCEIADKHGVSRTYVSRIVKVGARDGKASPYLDELTLERILVAGAPT